MAPIGNLLVAAPSIRGLGALWGLVISSAVLLLLGVGILIYWIRIWRRRERTTQTGLRAVTPKRLLGIWDRFILPLPPTVRAALPEYDRFIVLGDPGAGKSALISRRVDWQGQSSLFLPSYTADPLLQIYLGSGILVQEISATLLQTTSRESHEAFRRLWRASLPSGRPPTAVVVLKVSSLSTSTPDVLRQQAQLIRGKLNLLSELYGASVRTRICLTNMERVSGYSEFARFLHKNRIPLVLDVGTDAQGGLAAGVQGYEKYVPRALTTLPIGHFEASVNLLRSADAVMTPVRSFIEALVEDSVASARPDVQKVFFFSPQQDENVGNPFEAAGSAISRAPSLLSRWLRWLRGLGIQPLHAALGLLVLLGGLVPLGLAVRHHGEQVRQASAAAAELTRSVRRAQESLSVSSESDVVRRAEQHAALALLQIEQAETRFRPLRLLLRLEKSAARQQFTEAVRLGYLKPALESGVRQRARDKILFALAAIYARRDSALGALVRSHSQDFSATLGLPVDLLLDYVRHSERPWGERVLLLLPPLPSESERWPIADLRPWREFMKELIRSLPLPFITPSALDRIKKEGERLQEALDRVRKASVMRRIYQILSEESPLDMARLFGPGAGVLSPDPFLRDNAATLERLLKLVRDSSLHPGRHGTMSLYQLLKWINSLAAGTERAPRPQGGAQAEEDLIYLAFPDSQLLELSERAWLELLLRSRKRILLAQRIGSAGTHHGRRSRCCQCAHGHAQKPRCRPCLNENAEAEAVPITCPARRRRTHSGTEVREPSAAPMPPFTEAELKPRLAQLMTSDQAPSERLAEEYNRVVFDNEVLPLVRELKKALSESKVLTADEKLRLTRIVRGEIEGYARRYCGALLKFHLSFPFPSGGDLHTALLGWIKPGSRFLTHLRMVADNATLRGLDDPYLRPLQECLAEFKPLVTLVSGEAGSGAKTAGTARPDPDREPQGLKPYIDSVARQIEELDQDHLRGKEEAAPKATSAAAPAQPASGKPAALYDHLNPIGRSALAMAEGRDDTPRAKAEQFLDQTGIAGPLRRPFLEPFDAIYHRGAREIERTLAQHWQTETLPMVSSLLLRFPFNQGAEREVAPSELEVLNETGGAFWMDLRAFYAPVLIDQAGTYRARSGALGTLSLPRDLLLTVNPLLRLSRTLFSPDGKRQPLRITVRGVEGRLSSDLRIAQPAVTFLQVGKAASYSFNQRASADVLAIDWWDQGVAIAGVESVAPRSGRKHTQTLEVADSAWGLYRLLQKSTQESDGTSTWRILSDGVGDDQLIRFLLQPDPWAIFRIKLP